MNTSRIVMLIDDDAIHNFINERVIRLSGFADQILIHESASAALEYLKNVEITPDPAKLLPELIFLDINMPLMDGFQFLQSLRSQSSLLQKLRIIILTASLNPADKERCEEYSQVTDYLCKPLTSEILEELKQNGNS